MHAIGNQFYGQVPAVGAVCAGNLLLESFGMRLKASQIRFCALFAVVTMLPSSVLAAAFWNLDQGVSSFGRAGANIVMPGDPTAVY